MSGSISKEASFPEASHDTPCTPSPVRSTHTSPKSSRFAPRPKWTDLVADEGTDGFQRPRMGSRQGSAVSLSQLSQLLQDIESKDADNYGVTEVRDGFFDASFLKPSKRDAEMELLYRTLPAEFDKSSPFEIKNFIPRQWEELKMIANRVTTTRVGLQLLKAFMAIFSSYIICLVPVIRKWLGPYHYILVLSVIFNHPARSIGSQLDGVILTSVGTAAGFGWGVVGLILSTSTLAAKAGYGGVLAVFLLLLIAGAAWIRACFIRFYQAVLCAGIAIIYTTVADTNSQDVQWFKLLQFFIPWALGQVLALTVNIAIFPDTGAWEVSKSMNSALNTISAALEITGERDVRQRRQLVQRFLDLSQMVRDMVMDMSISKYHPDDVRELRNLMQGIIRATLTIEPAVHLIHHDEDDSPDDASSSTPSTNADEDISIHQAEGDPTQSILDELESPTKAVIFAMKDSLDRCNAALMDISGFRNRLGPAKGISSDLAVVQIQLDKALAAFDTIESKLLDCSILSSPHLGSSAAVEAFVFSRHVRESAVTIQKLSLHVQTMQKKSSWSRIYLPSYPLSKAIYRTNAQIRHDRGGAAAGSYQGTFSEIEQVLETLKGSDFTPGAVSEVRPQSSQVKATIPNTKKPKSATAAAKNTSVRYRIWETLHRLQGFESKYAFKACLVLTLLSIPSYLDECKEWWDRYQVWWAVAMSWIVMHPQVGGNIQDLFNRSVFAILGAVWAGASYAAGDGNPYIMAVFAALYLLPMSYRFTQSTHPRSGLVGCITFVVISLTLDDGGITSPALLAVHRGVVFFVGTAAPILVNWLLWPFIARHELRFALSSMLFYVSVVYRSVLSTYIYYEDGCPPTADDIQQSELLEGRLREGFVRIRQLLVLTRHEARLRAPFDPVAYSALTESCEQLFEHLIAVRQSALFHNAGHLQDSNTGADDQLLSFKRDAVAAILANLYIFAGALRSHRKVPRYIPSAAAARRRLLLETQRLEEQMAEGTAIGNLGSHKKWSEIYRYSYDQSLTGCVVQLEKIEKYTKLIVGEQGFDDHFTNHEN